MNSPPYVVRITGNRQNDMSLNGTGFIVDTVGHVVTCLHLVSVAEEIIVHLPYEITLKYRIYTKSTADDLAILESIEPLNVKIRAASLHPDWKRDTKIGDAVEVWGFSAPEHYVTPLRIHCTISGFSEKHGRIGINGDVNIGDSGAPVVNANGKVIGVLQAKDSKRNGQAMVIPISLLFKIFQPKINGKKAEAEFKELSNNFNGIRFAVPGFSADIGTERDLIGIGAEVDAFAYLIAATKLHPPMAIGLFGDWGSGKSFFMESLRQRIYKITADARQSSQPQGKIYIYKYIAQIEFNAWQYVEGELWASLVENIFRNLKTQRGDQLSLLQKRQQIVIKKLENKRLEQQEAKARQAMLKRQLSRTQDYINRLENERKLVLEELNKLRATDILKAIHLSNEEKEAILQILEDLGVMRPETNETNAVELNKINAAELMQYVDELRAMLERGNALTTPMREKHGWRWTGFLIVVILIGPIISLALRNSLMINIIGDLPPVTNALVSMSAFLSCLTIMLKKGTTWLSVAQARVKGIQQTLDEKRSKEEEDICKKIAEEQRKYNKMAANYDKAKNDEKEKSREIAELELELQRITPGRLLLDFINERVCSEDYRKHLGIAARIRSDFEQLSQLIAEQNAKFENDEGEAENEDEHLINRIVLYIDDLDRCPPDRVVQVLQAIHLLLAFPLFVVVVAVDARWLSQSLQAHYQSLLSTSTLRDDIELSKSLGRQASPQDYLEKIFQIPFWVRPLPEKARIRIVKGIVSESLVTSLSDNHDEELTDSEQIGTRDNSGAKVDEKRDALWEAEDRRRPFDLDANTDLKPQSLDIEEIEIQFMDELSSLLGQTPRSVKRFVNIYQLIKAISLNDGENFVEDKPDADFKLVLFLLAVLTGLPSISREFFSQLHAEPSEKELSQIKQQANIPRSTLGDVLEATKEFARGSGYKELDAWNDLNRLELWLKKHEKGSWLELDANVFAYWAPKVVRFSFRKEEI